MNALTPPAFTRHPLSLALWGALSLGLTACGGGGDDAPLTFKPIELNIAHLNDHHSQLEPFANTELSLDGVPTQVDLGGFTRQTTVFKSLAATPNLLKLHAGDAITGSLYYTFFKGKADAQLMNSICFDAFTPGNHEFDDGDGVLKGFLDALADPANGGACKTPTVSANIVPQAGTPLAPAGAAGYLQPSVIKKIDGVDVGIVGVSTGVKTVSSSRPLATTQFLDEVPATQKAIDALKARGVRHIVLLSHLGFDGDKALAAQLTDVDVIIGGDSHTLLGDFKSVGLSTGTGAYPTVVKNKSGETVCIGQAWEYAKAYGLMNVKFNESGSVSQCGGKAQLVIGDNYKRSVITTDTTGKQVTTWQPLADAERQALTAKLASHPAVKVAAPDAAAAQTLSTYASQVTAQKAITIGTASEALCLMRVPGGNNRSTGTAGCEAANTLARGSDAAQVVAEAFLRASKRADFALQNAGGVRTPIAAGTLSMNTAFTLLPFTNVLVEMDLKGSEVVAALEDGASSHLDAAVPSDGAHPYAAGLRWDLDMSKAKGQRCSNVQVKNKTTGAWTAIDPAKTYVLVTNDFVAAGGDGYNTLKPIYAAGRYVNTYLLYTQSFVDYVIAKGTISRPAAGDYAHQKVTTKAGVALP
ncbi:MAG: 5'-nucleotidase C-terminal domain-containing protein [Burkholderiaceae bacterium]|nr:5'-nucleotidase C-terminal domain-containing protein [Burkholderiaceae bacterium]